MTTTPEALVTAALKPCPFCGADDPVVAPNGDLSNTVSGGCRNPDCVLFDCFPGDYRDLSHFAEWWNTRTQQPAITEQGTSSPEREAVARIVIGPRNPVPADSRFSLRDAQDARWKLLTDQERKEALWIADSILAALPGVKL